MIKLLLSVYWLDIVIGSLLLFFGAVATAFFGGALFVTGDKPPPSTRKESSVWLAIGIVATVSGGLLSTYGWGLQSTEQTRAFISGGNSFVWVIMAQRTNNADQVSATAVHGGDEYMAYDVTIEFDEGICDDFEEWTLFKAVDAGSDSPRNHYLTVVAPNNPRPLPVMLEPACDNAYYLTVIQTRNRLAVQQSLLSRIQGRWYFSARLLDAHTGQELMRYPADLGDVQWPDVDEFLERFRFAATL